MPEPLTYSIEAHIAHIRLLRGDLDLDTATALRDACTQVADDDAVRVLLIEVSAAFTGSPLRPSGERKVASAVAALTKPTIITLGGAITGHAVELALACDLRLASDTASFAMDQLQRGFIPWDGGTQRLPRLVGRARATELLLTGRRIEAQEALEIGLVHQIVPRRLLAEAFALAQRLADMAPLAAAYAKEAALKGLDLSLQQGLRLEADLAVLLHSSKDRAEGLSAFLKKRPPTFTGE